MKNLYEAGTAKEIRERIAQLGPTNRRQWGKMTAAQAMAHCSSVMEWAVGENNPPRMFLGYIFGPIAKSQGLSKSLATAARTPPRIR